MRGLLSTFTTLSIIPLQTFLPALHVLYLTGTLYGMY